LTRIDIYHIFAGVITLTLTNKAKYLYNEKN
jgi:hypothetical protein